MADITKITLAKEINGTVRYFYPSTSSDIVFYDDRDTVKDKIDNIFNNINTLNNDISSLQTIIGNTTSGLVKKVEDLGSTVGNNSSGLVKDVKNLETTVGNATSGLVKDTADLKTAVGNTSSGLVKDVNDLKTTIGDSTSGIIKDINNLKTTIGDSTSGLVKDVTDNTSYIGTLQTTVGNESSGLVKGVADNTSDIGALKTAVGNSSSGLVKDVNDLKTTVGGSSSGLVKGVNDNTSAIGTLQTTVGNSSSGLVKDTADLKTTVGNITSGLVKDTKDLKTTVGDSNSGLVKDVNSLKTTVGNSNSGLVKSVADNASAISTLQTTANGKSTVTSSTTNGNIKINGTETTVYTPSNIPASAITESDTKKFVTNDEKNKISDLETSVNNYNNIITSLQATVNNIDSQYIKCITSVEYNTLMGMNPTEMVGKVYEFMGTFVSVYGSTTLQQTDRNSIFHLYTYPISFPGYSDNSLIAYKYIQIIQQETVRSMYYGSDGDQIPLRKVRYWIYNSDTDTYTATSWIDNDGINGMNIIDNSTKISSMAFVENSEDENILSYDYLSSHNGSITNLNNADTRVPTSEVILNSIGGHSFSYGDIPDSQYVYGYNSELNGDTFYTITGNYYLIGKFCFLNGCVYTVAKNNNPWYDMYYPLPVAFYHDASTLAYYDNEAYIVHTTYDKGVNTYLHVSKIVRSGMPDRKPLNFTLIYRYAE